VSAADVSPEEIANRFIEAFNQRDAERLVTLCDPSIEFHPTVLIGERRVYHGHDGVRQWVAQLVESGGEHQVRVREVRVLDPNRFLVLSEVLLGGQAITPSAMLARLGPDGGITEVHAYLSDEQMLIRLGLVPERPARPEQP
jgi:hypothetical protein